MIERMRGKRVVGYVRVSTDEQAATGVSLDAQRHRLRAYCEAHGLELVGVEADEGLSARTTNRPALQRALAALRDGDADGLVAVKLDRLSRSTRDVLDLVSSAEREGWALHSIEERLDTSSPHGRFVVTVLAALAQMERETIGARTSAALAELRRQGRRTSRHAPYGYRLDGDRLVEVPEEKQVFALAEELRAGGMGCVRIANELNRRGLRARNGREWYGQLVERVLRPRR